MRRVKVFLLMTLIHENIIPNRNLKALIRFKDTYTLLSDRKYDIRHFSRSKF